MSSLVPRLLRLATYNIHRAVGMDGREDFGRVAAVIAELDADVIGLQEVEWQHDASHDESQFEHLAHFPGYRAIPGRNIRDHRGHYGNVLLSRLPVREVRRFGISFSMREPRGAIVTDIATDALFFRVIVTHFGLGIREGRRQACHLRDIVCGLGEEAPTFILGDLNDWLPGMPTLRPLMRLCPSAVRPRSFPASRPVLALDLILACRCPKPTKVWAHATPLARKASDHLPVLATVETAALRRQPSVPQEATAPLQEATLE